MKRHFGSCAIILLVASCAGQADAIYSSETTWAAAVPGATIVNYTGIAAADALVQYGTGPGATTTLNSVTYTAVAPTNSEDYLGVLGSDVAGVDFGVPTLAVGGEPAGPASLLITLPNPVNALGFFFDTDDTVDVAITLSDGTVEVEGSATFPTLAFFGVTSTNAITSVEISNASYIGGSPENALFLSEFAYGPSVAATPEPGSVALTFAGLAVFGLAAGRKRLRSSRQRRSA
jgi:hypothetical protein